MKYREKLEEEMCPPTYLLEKDLRDFRNVMEEFAELW